MKFRKIAIALLLIILMLSSTALAATVSSSNTTFSVVENNVCEIDITEYSHFTKKLTQADETNKELLMTLTVNNTSPSPLSKPSEIVLLIDNSYSMNDTISTGGIRMTALQHSAKELASSLMSLDTVRVSVVSFSEINRQGLTYTDPEWQTRGTINDAKVRTPLTNDLETVLAAIDDVAETDKGTCTNLEAGITLATQQLTGECLNQYVVILSDGVPNLYLENSTVHYSDETADSTIAALTRFQGQGINFITMLTGVTDGQINDYNPDHVGLTYADCAEEIFGTPQNPSFGPYYFITDDLIEQTVSQSILDTLMNPNGGAATGIVISDYFPSYIVDNFDIELGTPSKGTATLESANKLVWTIDKINSQETATLTYKLKLKANIDDSIINVVLDTNEKVDITSEEGGDKTSNVTPKVKLIIEGSEDPKTGTVIVKYLEKGTDKPLADEDTLTGTVNQSYTTTRKTITGYVAADPEPTNKEGVFTEEPITVIYYYTKEATVTVQYLEKGTNKKLADDYVLNGKPDEAYKVQRKAITGYTAADPEPTNKEGTFTEEPITVKFYYTKNIDPTVSPTNIPQTGATVVFSTLLVGAVSYAVSLGFRSFKNRDII